MLWKVVLHQNLREARASNLEFCRLGMLNDTPECGVLECVIQNRSQATGNADLVTEQACLLDCAVQTVWEERTLGRIFRSVSDVQDFTGCSRECNRVVIGWQDVAFTVRSDDALVLAATDAAAQVGNRLNNL